MPLHQHFSSFTTCAFFSAVFFILLNTFSTRFFMCIFAALTARAIIFTALFVGETPWATFLCCLLLVHYQKIKKMKGKDLSFWHLGQAQPTDGKFCLISFFVSPFLFHHLLFAPLPMPTHNHCHHPRYHATHFGRAEDAAKSPRTECSGPKTSPSRTANKIYYLQCHNVAKNNRFQFVTGGVHWGARK